MSDHEEDRGGEIRSLIIVPITDAYGHVIGSLSVDYESRGLKDLSDDEREAFVLFSGPLGSLGYKSEPSPDAKRLRVSDKPKPKG